MTQRSPTPPGLRIYTKLTAASTLFLIFAGAMVTSTDSGLAVPDWPLSYGQWMPPMVGGIFYEHGHRMIAAMVGFMTLVQAFWLQFREPKRTVRILGWIALLAVIVQGLLGGLTVLFLLPTAISVSHAALAELFFCLNVTIALMTSASWSRWSDAAPESRHYRLELWSKILVGTVYVQIVVGAIMRHLGAGLAIPDFPLAFGRLVPPLTSAGLVANFGHRLGAVVVSAVVATVAVLAWRSIRSMVRRLSGLLVVLLMTQVTLGAYTVWSGKHPLITSFHVMTGASILAVSLLIALSAHGAGQRESVTASSEEGSRIPA